jgi:antitoxin HicB
MKKSLSPKKESAGSLDKDLDYFMGLNYPYSVEEIEEDGKKIFSLSITDLPGCGAEGETIEEGRAKLEEAKEAWIQTALDAGLPIPEPDIEDEFSGKFLLRIQPKLHMKLSKRAEREGMSLNQLIRLILEENINNYQVMTKLQLIENSLDELRIEFMAMSIKPDIGRSFPRSWEIRQKTHWKLH